MKALTAFLTVIASCLVMSNCGGGGGSEEAASASTVRPKTLDGLNLTFANYPLFEFSRTIGTAAAVAVGDVERGTFFYTLLPGVQRREYPNIAGDDSNCHWPDFISGASYTYRPTNETSGVLTLSGLGVNDTILTGGAFTALNGSFAYFFNWDSSGTVVNQIELDLTFTANGPSITLGTTTVRIPGSATPQWDTVRIPGALSLATGGAVPVNYNPKLDALRESKLVPVSLNNTLVNFTNGAGNTANDFTIQFTADASGMAAVSSNNAEEVGQGLLRISGAVVDNAVNYSWRRIPGTDSATLTLSGANNTFDGKYTLNFTSTDVGAYIGEVDALTTDIAEVSGSFSIPKAP